MPFDAALRQLDAHFQAMPPVAALGLQVLDCVDGRLRLGAPLSRNVNDKGCAFGGSLTSLMTLAGWGLATLRLADAVPRAEIYVAESTVRYRAPLYDDLLAEAWLDAGQDWAGLAATLLADGKARLLLSAHVRLPDGGVAAECRSRYVAIAAPRPAAG